MRPESLLLCEHGMGPCAWCTRSFSEYRKAMSTFRELVERAVNVAEYEDSIKRLAWLSSDEGFHMEDPRYRPVRVRCGHCKSVTIHLRESEERRRKCPVCEREGCVEIGDLR